MSLLTQAMVKQLEQSDTPEPMISGLNEYLGQIEDVMARFQNAVSKLKNSQDFSATGKEKRTMEAAQQAADELRGIENSAHGYDDHIRQLEDGLKPDKRPTDSTLAFLQEQEIRQRLADLDPLELQIKYQDACGNGGAGADLIAAAVENDPMPRLSADIIQEGIQARGLRTSPDEARKLKQIVRVRSALKDAIQEARGELQKNGLPVDDFLT